MAIWNDRASERSSFGDAFRSLAAWSRLIARKLLRSLCVAAGSALLAAPAMALDVSGFIGTDTTWTVADSPINVLSDLYVIHGALLTIEPGVQVRFAAGTQFGLTSGAIRAVGSVSSPIVFDSAMANPAAGDWGPIYIEDGGQDASTVWESVAVRHGKGVVLHRASPMLNRIAFENNQGAAVSLDLESSPTGVGLTASGNGLNGIAIPPGTITGFVRWGLVGIPYVVSDGIVTIGLPPMTLAPTTLDLRQGQQGTFTLQLAKPAPTGGLTLDVVSSAPGVASVASSITMPAGTLQKSITIDALSAGQTIVTISRLELGAVSAAVTVRPPITLSITPATSTMIPSSSSIYTVQLSEPAPVGGLTVALNSSNPSVVTVPASEFIFGGSTSGTFTAQANSLGTSTLTASASASGFVSATATVQVRSAYLSISNPGVLQPGTNRNITVTLSEPAPATGVSVALTSSQPGVVSLPSSVFISGGGTSRTVSIHAGNEGTANLSATALGHEPASISVVVTTIQLLFDPTSAQIPVGTGDHFVVRVNRLAGAGGLTVTLSSSAPASATVTPSEVIIPEGQTAGSVPVVVTGLVANASATIRAESDGVSSGFLSVGVSGPASLRFDPAAVVIGRDTQASIYLTYLDANGNYYRDRDPLSVNLTSSDPSRLSVPNLVTIPAGDSWVLLPVTATSSPLAPGVLSVSATAASITNVPLQVTIAEPMILISGLDQTRAVGSMRDDFYVELTVPGSSTSIQAVHNIPVGLSITEANPAGVVSGLFDAAIGDGALSQLVIPAGSSFSSDGVGNVHSAYVASPESVGTYRIAAQVSGQPASVSDVQVVTDTLSLAFSYTELRLANGMQSNAVVVQRLLEGGDFYGADPVMVSLTVSEPGKVDVPVNVEIPVQETSVTLPLVGLDLTSTPVIISAQAPGYAAPAEDLSVIVEPATINLDLNTEQAIGAPRSAFTVSWEYNPKGDQQFSPVDRAATVTVIDQNPAGIVDGLYAHETGPETIGPLTLRGGDYQLTDTQGEQAVIYAGSPTTSGTYRIRVSLPGMGEWTSDVVVVAEAPPSLSFSSGFHIVGLGLQARQVSIVRSGLDLGQPLIVDLASADPSIVSVPAQVVVPPGELSAVVPLSGVAVSDQPNTITAQAHGNGSLTASMTALVLDSRIEIKGGRSRRGIGGERDDFWVSWYVGCVTDYGCSSEPYQAGQTDTAVALSISGTPVEIVDGLFAGPSGIQVRNSLVIRAGQSESTDANGDVDRLYVGVPSTSGSYVLQATVAGQLRGALTTTVNAPFLGFTLATHEVGVGLRASAVHLRRMVDPFGTVEAANADLSINLSCAVSSICQVPATVTLPAGQTEVVVPISGVEFGSTRLAASAPGYAMGAQPDVDVRVVRPRLSLGGVPSFLRVGQSAAVVASVDVPGSSEGYQPAIAPISVTLSSSVPGVASITPVVVIPGGSDTSGEATLLGLAPGQTTVTPSAANSDWLSSGVWIVE